MDQAGNMGSGKAGTWRKIRESGGWGNRVVFDFRKSYAS